MSNLMTGYRCRMLINIQSRDHQFFGMRYAIKLVVSGIRRIRRIIEHQSEVVSVFKRIFLNVYLGNEIVVSSKVAIVAFRYLFVRECIVRVGSVASVD